MNYTYPPEEYVKLLNEYVELDKLAFSPDADRETVLKVLLPPENAYGLDLAIAYLVAKLLLDYYRDSGDSLRYAEALFDCITQELALST